MADQPTTELPKALRVPIRTTAELAAALLALDELSAADAAEAANALNPVVQPVLARYRRHKWLEAYENGEASQTELAARADVDRRVVTKRIARARLERTESA